jgi:hypothetical protein
MAEKHHVTASDIRGAGQLAIDATIGLTDLVESLHHNISRAPGILGEPVRAPTKGITGIVYRSIRGVSRLVGSGIDALLGRLVPLIAQRPSSTEREAVVAALNGVLGDHLAETGNPLAITAQLRHEGKPLQLDAPALAAALPKATGKIVVFVHGLCMNDLQWRRNGRDHSAALLADARFTPVWLHYNSGLHISSNGRLLAGMLEALLQAWPVPVEELAIVAHSMGGLVSRSAHHYGTQAGHGWTRHLGKIVFLGTPHHGAPLERGGNWIDVILDASPYTAAFAKLGKVRSAGITDLRHGSLLDGDWARRDRFKRSHAKPLHLPLPEGVACHAIAASLGKNPGDIGGRILGDGLVPVASALGRHKDPGRCLAFPASRQWIGYGMNHLDLLDSKEVGERILAWLSAPS